MKLEGFQNLFYVFDNARLTSLGRGNNDDIYILINDIISNFR